MTQCKGDVLWCRLLLPLGHPKLVAHRSQPRQQVTSQHGAIQPRDVYSSDSSLPAWVVIVIVLVVFKLAIVAILLYRCNKRRKLKDKREEELEQQSRSLLTPSQPQQVKTSKATTTCTEPHLLSESCRLCGMNVAADGGVTSSVETITSPTAQCTSQHVTGVACSQCGITAATDRLTVASETSAAKRKSSDKPRCHGFHLPWRKCATCRVDPPRNGHIELDSKVLPPGPHEMQAHVPTWQGHPEQRTENYGGFFEPEMSESAVRPAWSRYASLPQHPAAVVTPHPHSVPSTIVVGDGHKSYVSYQAASGQDRHPHVRTREVSPVAEERTSNNG